MESESGTIPGQPSLRSSTISGVRWLTTGTVTQQLTQFVVGITLMRLLVPMDFGLLDMIIVFSGFLLLFSDMGLARAIVQAPQINEVQLATVFWISLFLGALFGVGLFSCAGLISDFYDEPRLELPVRIAAMSVLLGPVSVVPRAILWRDMRFNVLSVIETAAVVISGGTAILLAWNGYGVFSLLAHMIGIASLNSILLWWVVRWRPRFLFSPGSIRNLWGFGQNLMAATFFGYVARNADNLLVGKYIGPTELGTYSRAYSIMLMPVNQVAAVLGRVFFPAFSRLQENRDLLKRIYLRVNRLIALITMPIGVGLFLTAEPFVVTVFGEAWREAAVILKILCLVAIVQPVSSTTGWIFQASGRTDLLLRWTVIDGIVTIAAFLAGLPWGISGVASAYVIRTYALWYPAIAIPGSLIDMSVTEYSKNLLSVLGCALAMGVTVAFFDYLLPPELYSYWRLLILVCVGCVAYPVWLMIARDSAFLDALALIREQLGPGIRP